MLRLPGKSDERLMCHVHDSTWTVGYLRGETARDLLFWLLGLIKKSPASPDHAREDEGGEGTVERSGAVSEYVARRLLLIYDTKEMILDRVFSPNNKLIRLTDERWLHIIENHTEIAGLRQEVLETIHAPEFIAKGIFGELYACRKYEHLGNYLVVVYKEQRGDGFIITAFRVRNIAPYIRKEIVWKKP